MGKFFEPLQPSTYSYAGTIIAAIASNDHKVTAANFDNQRLTDENVKALVTALPQNTYLKQINLAMTNLTIQHLTDILKAIKKNKFVTSLFLPSAQDDPVLFKQLLDETQEHVEANANIFEETSNALGTSKSK